METNSRSGRTWVCILVGQEGGRVGEWVQVTNYKMCLTRRCWGGSSATCAVEVSACCLRGGVENIFFLLA